MPFLAIGGVELVIVVIALAALLVVIAGYIFIKPTSDWLGTLPGIAGSIGQWISGSIEGGTKAAASTLMAKLPGVAHAMWAMGIGAWHLFYQAVEGTKAVNRVANVGVQRATAAVPTANAYTDAQIGLLYAELSASIAVAELAAEHAASLQYNHAEAQIGTLGADLTGAIQNLERDISRAQTAADAYAAGLVNALSGKVVGSIDQLEKALEVDVQNLNNVINGVRTSTGTAIAGLQGDVSTLEGELAPLVKALPIIGTIPLLNTAVQALTAEADQCLKPLCDTVTPNAKQLGDLGKLLTGLEGIAEAGLLAALVAAALEDPAGTAKAVVDVTGWIPTLGVDLAKAAGAVL